MSTFEELFDPVAGTPPQWAVVLLSNLDLRGRMHAVFVGMALWQLLVAEVLVERAGTMLACTLSSWRATLIDSKDSMKQLASCWALPTLCKVSPAQWPGALLHVISRQGTDLAAGTRWIAQVIAPAVARARDDNLRRLLVLHATGPPPPPAPARATRILAAMAKANEIAWEHATIRVANPYAPTPDPLSFLATSATHLAPGQLAMVQLLLAPTLSATLLASVQNAVRPAGSSPMEVDPIAGSSDAMDVDAVSTAVSIALLAPVPVLVPPVTPRSPPRKRRRLSDSARVPLSPLPIGSNTQAAGPSHLSPFNSAPTPLHPASPPEKKPYRCPQCPKKKRLFTAGGLELHLRAKH
ncbi:hypothetical protein B0H16DRAFT_1685978 [Mycena metata]|uniref:Uncharacterized protein n=1 Tax=Mycena metata TaxID=1033252 RepID=A0AAD7JQJ4_9AGAR|nr:hypothetical protein B0H16DRAFT_1685978 [Mycena metata]